MNDIVYVGVIGAAQCGQDVLDMAEDVGKAVAKCGAVLICGGRGGVMEAVAKGATNSGGTAIGILPGDEPRSGNPYLSFAIATGMGDARNVVIARTSDILVAVAGSYGTLSEIGLALKMGKPVIALNSWQCIDYCGEAASVIKAVDAAEAEVYLNQLITQLQQTKK